MAAILCPSGQEEGDQEGGTQVRYYQVDLTLISLADNRIVWVGQKKIKKFITKASFRP